LVLQEPPLVFGHGLEQFQVEAGGQAGLFKDHWIVGIDADPQRFSGGAAGQRGPRGQSDHAAKQQGNHTRSKAFAETYHATTPFEFMS
jgi:hypothetical protein